jgi:SNF2 family DNA or RNA helicase
MPNKLVFTERYIEITCPRGDIETLELLANIPYVHRNRTQTLFRTTIRNIIPVLKVFRGIEPWDIENTPLLVQKLFDKEAQRQIATKTLVAHGPTDETHFGKYKLMSHQQLGLEIADVNDKFGFFYDTRTGKTPMSLAIIDKDIKENPNHKWLVLCPLILIENAWLEDATEMFPHLKVVSLHAGTKAKRLKQFAQDANVYVLNIESFIGYRDEVEKLPIHGVFVDESSTMKSSSSKFGKAAVDYAWTRIRWYLLSGTPAPNGEWEYYRQLQSIDFYGVHQSYAQFKQYFFENVSYNPQYEKLKVREDKRHELLRLLRSYSLYVDKEDVLETPGRDFNEVELTMPKELKEHYEMLRKNLYLELGDSMLITAPSTAASLNKLNQVSSGFVIDTLAIKENKINRANGVVDEHKEVHLLDTYRFDKLDELLHKLGSEQAIIWCVYREEFKQIKKRLGDNCGMVYGGTSIGEKNATIRAFKEGRIQYLIANPASADKGLTLTNAHISIYFSLGYSYELWKQSIERIYGDIRKQPKRCQYYIFIAKGTVDRSIYTTVQSKGDMSMAVLNHLKSGG